MPALLNSKDLTLRFVDGILYCTEAEKELIKANKAAQEMFNAPFIEDYIENHLSDEDYEWFLRWAEPIEVRIEE